VTCSLGVLLWDCGAPIEISGPELLLPKLIVTCSPAPPVKAALGRLIRISGVEEAGALVLGAPKFMSISEILPEGEPLLCARLMINSGWAPCDEVGAELAPAAPPKLMTISGTAEAGGSITGGSPLPDALAELRRIKGRIKVNDDFGDPGVVGRDRILSLLILPAERAGQIRERRLCSRQIARLQCLANCLEVLLPVRCPKGCAIFVGAGLPKSGQSIDIRLGCSEIARLQILSKLREIARSLLSECVQLLKDRTGSGDRRARLRTREVDDRGWGGVGCRRGIICFDG
jgi:hypothetical protein